MKCPRCRGSGSVPYPIDYEQGLFDETNCPLCGGGGKVEQTNEDWFCELNTEEKAKELLRLRLFGAVSEKGILRWLKQTHTEKE